MKQVESKRTTTLAGRLMGYSFAFYRLVNSDSWVAVVMMVAAILVLWLYQWWWFVAALLLIEIVGHIIVFADGFLRRLGLKKAGSAAVDRHPD